MTIKETLKEWKEIKDLIIKNLDNLSNLTSKLNNTLDISEGRMSSLHSSLIDTLNDIDDKVRNIKQHSNSILGILFIIGFIIGLLIGIAI